MTGYNAQDSAGFIRLFGLPLATAARRAQESAANDETDVDGNGATEATSEPAGVPAVPGRGVRHAF